MADENQQGMGIDYIELAGVVTNPEEQAWDGINMVDVGTYDWEITGVVKGASSKGTPQLEASLKVVSKGPMEGKKMKAWYYMTPNSIGRLLNMLKAAGVPLDAKMGFNPQQLIGKRMRATVTHETSTVENQMTGAKTPKTSAKIVGEKPIPAGR